jgi:hypothetical protein
MLCSRIGESDLEGLPDLPLTNPSYLKTFQLLRNPNLAKQGGGPKTGPLSPSPDASDDELESLISASGLDSEALKTVLQKRLAEAGGPLEGLDQSLLLKYAMRMMTNEEASDDIAGELAEDMLNRPDDDPLAAGISSWLSQMGTPKKTQEADPQPEQTKKSGKLLFSISVRSSHVSCCSGYRSAPTYPFIHRDKY